MMPFHKQCGLFKGIIHKIFMNNNHLFDSIYSQTLLAIAIKCIQNQKLDLYTVLFIGSGRVCQSLTGFRLSSHAQGIHMNQCVHVSSCVCYLISSMSAPRFTVHTSIVTSKLY